MSRRAHVTPEQVGLPPGRRRRVPGLRRKEVAVLADISIEYYVQIERGNLGGVSEDIVHSIARALLLNEVETAHLFNLLEAQTSRSQRAGVRRSRLGPVSTHLQSLIDSMVGAPAVVQNGRLDIVATNSLGRALYADVFSSGQATPNLGRYIFLDERSREFFLNWSRIADQAAAMLRVEVGRAPRDQKLVSLVGDLATRSHEFNQRWARHDVTRHQQGTKSIRHTIVGELHLKFEALDIAGASGLTLFGYVPEPDDAVTRENLQMLASWAATPDAPAEMTSEDPVSPE